MEKGQPAFLVALLGAHAASQFAEKLRVLDLTPPDAGILRLLRIAAGLSQQEFAAKLQIRASRLVAILDHLENRGSWSEEQLGRPAIVFPSFDQRR